MGQFKDFDIPVWGGLRIMQEITFSRGSGGTIDRLEDVRLWVVGTGLFQLS